MRKFNYFSCLLEARQLREGETESLPAKEVLYKVLDANFQNVSFEIVDEESNVVFDYVYAKPPKEGMFLLKVTRRVDGLSVLVYIDTRTTPNYLWVERLEREDMNVVTKQVVNAIKNALTQNTLKYGWEVEVTKYFPGDPNDVDLFPSALKYVDDYYEDGAPGFYTYIKDVKRVWEFMSVLHQKLDHKYKAQAMMKVIRAAYDANIIERPHFESFIREFKKDGEICVASFNRYMTKDNLLADDEDYKRYLKDFLELVNKKV